MGLATSSGLALAPSAGECQTRRRVAISSDKGSARRPRAVDFELGYLAAEYLVGRRGDDLGQDLELTCPASERLQTALRHPERAVRAQALAAPLARLIAHLEESEL